MSFGALSFAAAGYVVADAGAWAVPPARAVGWFMFGLLSGWWREFR